MTSEVRSSWRLRATQWVPRSTFAAASLFVYCEVLVYFFYPAWVLAPLSRPLGFAAACAHLLILLALLAWWKRADCGAVPIPRAWRWCSLWSRQGVMLAATLTVLVPIQLYLMSWPITSGPDEPVQVRHHLIQWLALCRPQSDRISLFFYIVCVAGLGAVCAFFVAKGERTAVEKTGIPGKVRRDSRQCRVRGLSVVSIICAVLFGAGYYLCRLRLGPLWGHELRWPPFGTVAAVVSHGFLGTNEIAARMPALVFYVLTGLYAYRMVAAEHNRWFAFAGAMMLFSMPVFFKFGHISSREAGGAFFLTAGIYYGLRHMRFGNAGDLGMAALAASAGYLQRRPSCILVFIIPLAWILIRFAGRTRTRLPSGRHGIRVYAGSAAMALWFVLPWVIAARRVRPYRVHPANLLDPELVFAYLQKFPDYMGWPAVAALSVGIVAGLIRRKSVDLMALTHLLIVYALFSVEDPYYIPTARFTVMMCPAVAVLAAAGLSIVNSSIRTRPVFTATAFCLLTLLPLVSWLSGRPVAFGQSPKAGGLAREPYYPFNQVVGMLASQKMTPCSIAQPVFWQTALRAYGLMRNVEGLEEKIPPIAGRPRHTTLRELYAFCKNEHVDYAVIPLRREPKIRAVFVKDLEPEGLAGDIVPGFSVLRIFWKGKSGLALMEVDI